MKINKNFNNLENSYLFVNIARKAKEFIEKNPNASIIRMGIGDVVRPLVPCIIDEMKQAVLDMGRQETFKGYADEQGAIFLRDAVLKHYQNRNIDIEFDSIFIGDGAKSDIGNITDLFSSDNTVIIPDPVYPAYVDATIISGRNIIYINGNEENSFLPMPYDGLYGDIVYICSPNNPTGAVYTKEQLKIWVDWAIQNNAIILFDAAYECFIQNKEMPKSIFEIENAKKCAIEFCSFSKMAGFTGTRCSYTIIPKELEFEGNSIQKLWLRRQSIKFNGVAHIVQRGAAMALTEMGQNQIQIDIDAYMQNAKIMKEALDSINIWHIGGENAPYIWLKCPNKLKSWEFFDILLNDAHIIGTPGAGFGKNGEGFLRLSAFNSKENTIEAMRRIKKII